MVKQNPIRDSTLISFPTCVSATKSQHNRASNPTLAWAHDTGAAAAKTNVNGGGMANATIIERLG